MEPILLSFKLPIIGEVTFPAYFTLLTIGFSCAILLTWREARRLEIDPNKIIDINLWMIIFGLIGGRVLHVIADGHFMEYVNICIAPEKIHAVGAIPAHCTADAQCAPHFLCNVAGGYCYPPRDCLLALKVWRGGLTYYGGFIFSVAFGLYYLYKHRLPMWRVSDLAGYGIPLGLFWGRMGCYFNGCCFGKVTHCSLGTVFPRGGAAWRHQLDLHLITEAAAALPVHPAQLYLALANLINFFVVYFVVRPRKSFDGQVFWWFVVIKCLTRSAVEILRDDDRGVLFGWLSTSQMISLPLFALAMYMFWRLPRRQASVASRDTSAA
jgi:phosphatidylglycerol---prolipoprotein diacylglyceryl transferase